MDLSVKTKVQKGSFLSRIAFVLLVSLISTLVANTSFVAVAGGTAATIKVTGPSVVKIPASGSSALQFIAEVYDDASATMASETVTWSLVNNDDSSVSISSGGILTYNSNTTKQMVIVKAQSNSKSDVYTTKEVVITDAVNYPLFETFNGFSSGNLATGNGWTVSNNGAAITVDESPSAIDKSIKFVNSATNASTYPEIKYDIPVDASNPTKVNLELDVKFNGYVPSTTYFLTGGDGLVSLTTATNKVYYQLYKDSAGNTPAQTMLTVCDVVKDKWYHFRTEIDFTTNRASVYVNYSNTPALADIPFNDARYTLNYSRLSTYDFVARNTKGANASISVDNMMVSIPSKVDCMNIAGASSINIPASGSTSSAYSIDKYRMQGGVLGTALPTVVWSLSNAPSGVSVNTATGQITVESTTTQTGEFSLIATSGGVNASKKIRLDSDTNPSSILIENKTSAIKIPISGSTKLPLTAHVLNGSGVAIAGQGVSWSLVDSSDKTVSIDQTGLLAITNHSVQQVVTVKATSTSNPLLFATKDITITGGSTYALFEDFNNYPIGNFENGTANWMVKNNGATIEIVDNGFDKNAKITNPATAPGTNPSIEYYPPSVSAITDGGVVEFNVKFNGSAIPTWSYPLHSESVVLITAYDNVTSKNYIYYRQYKDSAGNDVPQANWQKVTEVVVNKWYHIKLVLNYKPTASGGQNATVYVDYSNTPVLSNMPFYDARYNLTRLNGFAFKTNTNPNSSMQISNIVMSHPNTLDGMKISGDNIIPIPKSGSTFVTYIASDFKGQGGINLGRTPAVIEWLLLDAPKGVTVNKTTGVLEVPSNLQVGKQITLAVQSEGISAVKKIILNSENYNASDITLKYSDGSAVSLFEPNKTIIASIDIENTSSSSSKDIMLLAALYDKNGVLSNVKMTNKHLDINSGMIPVSVSLTLPSVIDDQFIKVFLWDDFVNMMPIVSQLTYYSFSRPLKIYLAGDSITYSYLAANSYPQAGWGQFIGSQFTNDVVIDNRAMGGRSSKSFIDEGRLSAILDVIKPGDYLFIAFAHNDNVSGVPERYTDPNSTYKQYLTQYVQGARAKGAIPVFITSPAPLKFEGGTAVNSLAAYTKSMKDLAADSAINVTCIDLNAVMLAYYNEIGEARCKSELFIYDVVTQWGLTAEQIANHPDAPIKDQGYDSTHYSVTGAPVLAEKIADGIRNSKLPLKRLLK